MADQKLPEEVERALKKAVADAIELGMAPLGSDEERALAEVSDAADDALRAAILSALSASSSALRERVRAMAEEWERHGAEIEYSWGKGTGDTHLEHARALRAALAGDKA